MKIDVEWAGQVDYLEAWDRQKALVAERIERPETPGKFLLLEHPPTYTWEGTAVWKTSSSAKPN
jgi:lipoate-protein ligase B